MPEFVDEFTRVNGPLGGDWITGGSSAIVIVNNQAKHQNSSPGVGNNVYVATAIENQVTPPLFIELRAVYFVESTQRLFSRGVTVIWDEGFDITLQTSSGVFSTGTYAQPTDTIRLEFTNTEYRVLRKIAAPLAEYTLLYSRLRNEATEFGQSGFGMTNNSNGVGGADEGKGIIDNFRFGTLATISSGTTPLSNTISVGVSLGL